MKLTYSGIIELYNGFFNSKVSIREIENLYLIDETTYIVNIVEDNTDYYKNGT